AVILIVAVGGALVRAMVSPLYAYRTTLLWLMWTVGLGGYLVWLFGQAAHTGRARNVRAFQIAGALGLMFGIHDVGSLLAGHPLGGLLLSTCIPSLALLAIGWAMVADLGTALTQSEQLNVTLEQRVAEKHAELERNYARLRRLERDRAVTEERDRIMRDMHDGVGGQLVSTLAMVESGRFGPEARAGAGPGRCGARSTAPSTTCGSSSTRSSRWRETCWRFSVRHASGWSRGCAGTASPSTGGLRTSPCWRGSVRSGRWSSSAWCRR